MRGLRDPHSSMILRSIFSIFMGVAFYKDAAGRRKGFRRAPCPGQAIAEALGAAGAHVVVNYRSEGKAADSVVQT